MKRLNLIGKQYSRLYVVADGGSTKTNRAKWVCSCQCGKSSVVPGADLRSGHTQSCGCYQKEQLKKFFTKHGRCRSVEYTTWCNMKKRCGNKNSADYKYYGGRGISLCERWENDFINFYSDMGTRPPGNYSIERIDNNGNYSPENCKWATQSEQVKNRRVL